MAEERVVFDFTDMKTQEAYLIEFDFVKYRILRKEGIKKYSSVEVNDKVIVSFIIEKDEGYDCIYHKRTIEDIEMLIKNKEPINLKGCYIKDFDISQIDNYKEYELLNFNANYSFWDGDVNFEDTSFGDGDVSFNGVSFGDGDVRFRGVNFGRGFMNFSYASFGKGVVDFSSASFDEGEVCFDEASFGEGDVRFEATSFGEGEVTFDNASFGEGDVSFWSTNFGEGHVNFNDTSFGEGDVSFELTNFGEGDVSFWGASFGEGEVSFDEASFGEGDVSFNRASFGEGNVSFSWTNFSEGDMSFDDSEADNIIFVGMKFLTYEDLRFKLVNRLVVEDCTLEKTVKLAGINKKSTLSFEDTVNLGQLCFESKSKNVVNAMKRYIKQKKNSKNKLTKEQILKSITLVKENYHQLGEYDGEDRAYRLYMKYKTNTWYGWIFLKLFKWVGGYGTQPQTILPVMAGVMAFFAGIYCTFLKDQFKLVVETADKTVSAVASFWDALYYSGITFLTIGYGDISPALTGTALRFVSVTEGFIGLFLMSYLTVAVVRKLLRKNATISKNFGHAPKVLFELPLKQ